MEKRKRPLRGKKTRLKDFKEHFTKVPTIILHDRNLDSMEKLILCELQSYSLRPNYVLAYTRMASDLNIDKGNLTKRWHGLIKKGYIVSSDRYSINYDLLTDSDSNELVPIIEVGTTYLSSEKEVQTPPEHGGQKQPEIGVETDLKDRCTPATDEENKDEEKQNKNKEEKEFLNLIEKDFSENLMDKTVELISSSKIKKGKGDLIDSNSQNGNDNPKINSYEDFKRLYKDETLLKKLGSKDHWSIIQETNHLFSDAEYDLQSSIAFQLMREFKRPTSSSTDKEHKLTKSPKTLNSSAYDDLPWKE